ncbi:unnamed protein product [Cylicostephanus goldi]|uniref:sn-1-specific diacylglycerol lipase n=1 Tax=Cylicostephanus goldi TaxID=71465 RepID=A0A3P7MBZ3_CYLGO|nr:unnamed protein product [Cylicostephanus goldi]
MEPSLQIHLSHLYRYITRGQTKTINQESYQQFSYQRKSTSLYEALCCLHRFKGRPYLTDFLSSGTFCGVGGSRKPQYCDNHTRFMFTCGSRYRFMLSLDDEVLSVDVDADPLLRTDPSLDGEGEVRVHRGMLMSARYVYDTLRKHQVLEDLAVLNTGYQLVVCGHSLGAGVASLVTLLLKQDYPNVRCFAFAPPGCVITENGLHELEEHVFGIVAGDDLVSRISFHALHRLRVKVAAELDACTKAKYEILIRGIFRLFFTTAWESGPLSGESELPSLCERYRKDCLIRIITDRVNLIPEGGAAANGSTYGTAAAVVVPNSATAITLATAQRLSSRVQVRATKSISVTNCRALL